MTRQETPEKAARRQIDAALDGAGWKLQDRDSVNLHAGRGVAVRQFKLVAGYGYADYLLYVEQRAVGVIEAKKQGDTLTGDEVQAEKYATGMPGSLPAPYRPLPFLYQSTGVETRFTNRFDPDPRSRDVFAFHKPETLADWLNADPIWPPVVEGGPDPASSIPSTLRRRLRALPRLTSAHSGPHRLRQSAISKYPLPKIDRGRSSRWRPGAARPSRLSRLPTAW